MDKKKYVLFPTVYHTGMWFVAQLLHHQFGYRFIRYGVAVKMKDLPTLPPFRTLHSHLPIEIDVPKIQKIYEILNKDNKCLMVVPIRDVLASVVSRKRRHPGTIVSFIIDGFVSIVQEFKKFDPFYFPVDLHTKAKDREVLLTSLEGRLGTKYINVNNVNKAEFTKSWKVQNDTTDYCRTELGDPQLELKQAYDLGSLDYLKYILSDDWKHLISKRDILQPFFKKLGYKNLLWFEKEATIERRRKQGS